jgi:cell division GTPase FtsZ
MKLAVVGFGQAGGKILDRLLEYDTTNGTGIVSHAVAVNSAEADLMSLEHVPKENRLLIGQTVVDGHGAGTEPDLGRQCAEQDLDRIRTALDGVTSSIDAFLVVAGLGGGTGSGGSPVLTDHLQDIYTKPVYGLGILPAEDEGGIYNRNAADSLERFVQNVDNLLLFDNDAFKRSGESLADGYAAINDEIVSRFGPLFAAGELDALDGPVAESVVDASEIINTLGERGLTSVGYASEAVESEDEGLLGRLRSDEADEEIVSGDDAGRIPALVRKAALGTQTVSCGIDTTKRALLLVSGPPEKLNRTGIEEARSWLEETTDCLEVRTGDYPLPDEDKVAALVVFAGVTDIERIDDIQTEAVRAEEFIWNNERDDGNELDDLVSYDDPKSSALLD